MGNWWNQPNRPGPARAPRAFRASQIRPLAGLLLLAYDPAGHTFAGIASRLRFQVVGIDMDNHSMANDRIGAIQRSCLIDARKLCHARSVGFDVAEVAHM